jgi:hypothetical protein
MPVWQTQGLAPKIIILFLKIDFGPGLAFEVYEPEAIMGLITVMHRGRRRVDQIRGSIII